MCSPSPLARSCSWCRHQWQAVRRSRPILLFRPALIGRPPTQPCQPTEPCQPFCCVCTDCCAADDLSSSTMACEVTSYYATPPRPPAIQSPAISIALYNGLARRATDGGRPGVPGDEKRGEGVEATVAARHARHDTSTSERSIWVAEGPPSACCLPNSSGSEGGLVPNTALHDQWVAIELIVLTPDYALYHSIQAHPYVEAAAAAAAASTHHSVTVPWRSLAPHRRQASRTPSLRPRVKGHRCGGAADFASRLACVPLTRCQDRLLVARQGPRDREAVCPREAGLCIPRSTDGYGLRYTQRRH